VCECNADYVGDACEIPRFGATCAAGSADMAFYPFQGASFAGKMFMMKTDGSAPITLCPLEQGSSPDDHIWTKAGMVYTGTAAAPCELPEETGTLAGGDLKYTFYVYVQQHPSVTTASDLKVTIECTPPDTTPEVVSAVSVNMANAPVPINALKTVKATSNVQMSLYNEGTTDALTEPVAIDKKVDACFDVTMPSGGFFDNYILVEMKASNQPFVSPDPGNTLFFNMITEACVDKDAGGVVSKVTKVKTGDVGKTTVTFGVFRFDKQADGYTDTSSPTMIPVGTIWIQAKIVIGTYDRESTANRKCNEVTGAAGGPHLVDAAYADLVAAFARRKRRDTSNGEDIQSPVYLNLSLVMEDPFGRPSRNSHHEVGHPIDAESCYNSATFIVPLVVMGFLVVAAMFMTLFFCSRLNRHHGNHMDGTANMAYKS